MTLFRCDQCGREERRPDHQEPWLCPACGNMRWQRLSSDDHEDPPGQGDRDDEEEWTG